MVGVACSAAVMVVGLTRFYREKGLAALSKRLRELCRVDPAAVGILGRVRGRNIPWKLSLEMAISQIAISHDSQ